MSAHLVKNAPVHVAGRLFWVTTQSSGRDCDLAIREVKAAWVPGRRKPVQVPEAFLIGTLTKAGKCKDMKDYEGGTTEAIMRALYRTTEQANAKIKPRNTKAFYKRVERAVEAMFERLRENPPEAAPAEKPIRKPSYAAAARATQKPPVTKAKPKPSPVVYACKNKKAVRTWLLAIGAQQRLIWAHTLGLPATAQHEDLLTAYARNACLPSTVLKPWNGHAVLAWADRNGAVIRALAIGRFLVSGHVSDAEFATLCENTAARGWKFERRLPGDVGDAPEVR